MSTELEVRRAEWDTKEAIRQVFFVPNSVADANYNAIMDHKRERDVILLAEAIRDNGGYDGTTLREPPDARMVEEAQALAAEAPA